MNQGITRARPAAVSALANRRGFAEPGPGTRSEAGLVPGPYVGETREGFPRPISFRFVGSGIRDLIVDGRLVAQWIPVRGTEGIAHAGSSEVRVSWPESRLARGTVTRRRRGRAEVLRFVAEHRFRGLAG